MKAVSLLRLWWVILRILRILRMFKKKLFIQKLSNWGVSAGRNACATCSILFVSILNPWSFSRNTLQIDVTYDIYRADVYWAVHHCDNWRIKNHLDASYYFIVLVIGSNMLRALLCPSSGARDYDVDYNIGRFVLGLLYVGGEVQLGWSSVRAAAQTLLQPNCT